MTVKDFLLETEDTVLTQMSKEVNQLLNQSKTNFLSLGLFLNLPVEFIAQQTDSVPFNKKMTLPELANCFTSTVWQHDTTIVRFVFFYHNEKHLKHLIKVIKKYPTFFAFHYVKQLQHILRNHYTSAHQTFMMKNTSLDYADIKLANDYAVNCSLKEIFHHAGKSKSEAITMTNKWKELEEVIPYNSDYKDMTELQILKSFSNTPRTTTRHLYEGFIEVTTPESTKHICSTKECSTITEDADTELQNLSGRVYEAIRTAGKGGGGGLGIQTMMDQFESVETDTKWFKKLKTALEREVYYKTEKHSQTWSKINNRLRHIANLPTSKYSQDKIDLILSVDQSGSMLTLDLQKILYVFEKNAKRIGRCTVIVHTGSVDKVFTLESDYSIEDSPNWKFLQARLASGGTSHSPVFDYIQQNYKSVEQIIYMSFSDNDSDIEETISSYPIMRRMSKYWVSPIGSKLVDTKIAGGINVTVT